MKTADLTALQNEFGSRGLVPVVALFENNDRGAASARHALRYKEANTLDFPVLADGEAVFLSYFAERAHPMILILDAESMAIIYKEASWQRAEVEALVRERLENE